MLAADIIKIIALLMAWNALVFAIFFVDKRAARHGHWRVSEKTLLTLALVAGSPGAVMAQQLLRHKTRKEPFRSRLAAIAVMHLLIAMSLISAVAGRLLGLV